LFRLIGFAHNTGAAQALQLPSRLQMPYSYRVPNLWLAATKASMFSGLILMGASQPGQRSNPQDSKRLTKSQTYLGIAPLRGSIFSRDRKHA
jgi:hypothetical protein